jgi:phosphatidylserine/phosphatidylglycerophosphate/cardiolipin synthase-like enzyme
MYYGPTEETVTANHISGTGGVLDHSINISNLNPGEITWVQAFSVSGSDTAKSAITSFATISNSSGEIISYFNTPVDHSYSNGVDAIYLPETIDDTLIKYLERAKYTIDFTIYNFNNEGISNISDALIAAANSGVRVRVIGCGTTDIAGVEEMIGTSVHVLIGPDSEEREGIMHNKFIIFDAESNDPNDPLVWTGATNFTDVQINLDANDVIIIQDQSLARAYQIEFEEMWGSHDDEPDPENALFGSSKRNNTPHEFMINGKYVECYFSPSDGVNDKIVEVINTADNDLSIATMLMTRIFMAEAIADRKTAGVNVNVITNAEGNNNSTVNTILTESLGAHYTFDDVSEGILHHKYMIVDQYAPISDPMLLNGSHNWSASADNINDENTLIIHDATIANVYYQQFVHRFEENLGVLLELTDPPTAVDDYEETAIDELITIPVLNNDVIQAPVTVSIEEPATMGDSFIPFANPNVISYQPDMGFMGLDSILYKIEYNADPTLFDLAMVYINVTDDNAINEYSKNFDLNVSPNPFKTNIHISYSLDSKSYISIDIYNIQGDKIETLVSEFQNVGEQTSSWSPSIKMPDGIYFILLNMDNEIFMQKIIKAD